MSTNSIFPVQPNQQGDLLQQTAAKITAIDPHAIIPHDIRAARRLLADLEQKHGPIYRESAEDRRLLQLHETYNAMLPNLAKAKRLGVRPANAKPPAPPTGGGGCTPDDLQLMQEFAAQLDIDIAAFEATSPEQRRILRLETFVGEVVKHSNGLVDCLNAFEDRLHRLESVIQGPRAA